DGPATMKGTDQVLLWHNHVLEERLTESERLPGCEHRFGLEPGTPHVDEEEADAGLLLGGGVGADQTEDPVGMLRMGRPGLLPVDDEVALAVVLGTRLERGEVATGVRLRVTLAPDLVARQDLRKEAGLLGVRCVLHEEGPDHLETE